MVTANLATVQYGINVLQDLRSKTQTGTEEFEAVSTNLGSGTNCLDCEIGLTRRELKPCETLAKLYKRRQLLDSLAVFTDDIVTSDKEAFRYRRGDDVPCLMQCVTTSLGGLDACR
jgi:hypothetical protein